MFFIGTGALQTEYLIILFIIDHNPLIVMMSILVVQTLIRGEQCSLNNQIWIFVKRGELIAN